MDADHSRAETAVDAAEIFRDIYQRAGPGNAEMMGLKAVVEAIKETIAESSATPSEGAANTHSPTAYYAHLMVAFERWGPSKAQQVSYLLSLVMPHVPGALLRTKFGPMAGAFGAALQSKTVLENRSTMRALLACTTQALLVLEPSAETWARPDVVRLMSQLLSFAGHADPKVRKAAQQGVHELAEAHYSARTGACGSIIATYFSSLFQAGSQSGVTRIRQVTPVVSTLLPILPEPAQKELTDALLGLPSMGNHELTVAAFETLTTLLESPLAKLRTGFVTSLLKAVLAMQPSPDAHAPAAAYAYLVAAAMTALARQARQKADLPVEVATNFSHGGVRATAPAAVANSAVLETVATHLLPAVTALLGNFQSDRIEVQHATANALTLVLITCVDAPLVQQALGWATGHPAAFPTAAGFAAAKCSAAEYAKRTAAAASTGPVLVQLVATLDTLLQYKYQPSWPVSLPVLAVLYRILGSDAFPLANILTRSLASMHKAVTDAANTAALARGTEDDSDDEEQRRKKAKRRRMRESGGDSDEEGEDGSGGAAAGLVGGAALASAVEKTLVRVLGVAARAAGAHRFLEVVGLTDPSAAPAAAAAASAAPGAPPPAPTIAEDRAWVLPLLRDHAQASPCPLAVFMGPMMAIARAEEAAAAAAVKEGNSNIARLHRSRALHVWALLPALMVAPPDFTTTFGVAMGKLLTGAMMDPRYPELPTVIGRALETAIVRNRAAAGLPAIRMARAGDAADEKDNQAGGPDDDMGLTVAAGGKRGGGAGKAPRPRRVKGQIVVSSADDDAEAGAQGGDSDEEGDEDGSYAGGSRAGGSFDDGATLFGAGGVSVTAGGSASDPRHPLIKSALRLAQELPPIAPEAAKANLAVLSNLAMNYVPVLFNCYETVVLGHNPSAPQAPGSLVNAVSAAAANERSRKVLDAVLAYTSISPPEVIIRVSGKLHELLGGAIKKLSDAETADAAASDAHKAAQSAAAKGKAGRPTSETGSALAAAGKAVEAGASRVLSLLRLALAVVPNLPPVTAANADADSTPVARVYSLILPLLAPDTRNNVQKAGYAVLSALLAAHPAFGAAPSRRDACVELLVSTLPTASATARRSQLECLRFLVQGFSIHEPAHVALVPAILSQMLEYCKDRADKVRDAAFALVLGLAHFMAQGGEGGGADEWQAEEAGTMAAEEEQGARASAGAGAGGDDADGMEDAVSSAAGKKSKKKKDKKGAAPPPAAAAAVAAAAPAAVAVPVKPSLTEFFKMLAAGLEASTPHTRSAAIFALSSCVYEFGSTAAVHSLFPLLLAQVLDHMQELSREVITSAVGFVKVIITSMPPAEVAPHIADILQALFVWSKERKENIKAKIKNVVQRLIRKFGMDAVEPHVPATDAALLAYIRKQQSRSAKKREVREAAFQAALASRGGSSSASRAGSRAPGGGDDGEWSDEDEEESDGYGSSDDSGGEGASSVWPGTIQLPRKAGTALGGPGSRMSGVTASMRAGSKLLSAAAPLLPAPGTVVDPAVLSGRAKQDAKTLLTKVASQAGKTAALQARSVAGKTAAASGSRRAEVQSAVLRADTADAPLDLADPMAMRSFVGQDPATLAALERRRKAAERADAGAGGLKMTSDGRLIVEADSDEERRGKSKAKGGAGAAAADAAEAEDAGPARRGRAPSYDDEDTDDDSGSDAGAGGRRSGGGRWRGDGGAKARSVLSSATSRTGGAHKVRVDDRGSQGWGMRRNKGRAAGGGGGGGAAHTGAAYGSKKGDGDHILKGTKLEPHAYVPLDARAMSGGGGRNAINRFSHVMGSSVAKGKKANVKRGIAAEALLSRPASSGGGSGGAAASGGAPPTFGGHKRKRGE